MSWKQTTNHLTFGLGQAFRTIVSEPKDRIPLSWNIAVYPLLCYAPFIFLAYLARRPDTYLIRLLLLPSVICTILMAAYRFTWTTPELNVYNWGQALFAGVAIAKSLEYAFTPEGMLKLGESRPGVTKGKGKGTAENGHTDPQEPIRHPYLAPWFYDAMELIHTMRGLRWKFGRGVHIPNEWRPLERTPFLRATLWTFIKNFLILDLLESLLKLFPGVYSPMGGSMFYPSLSPVARYTVSTIIQTITGSALLAGFGMVYDLITLVAVFAFDSAPASWPPVMDDPWNAHSMHSFWAKNWHQLLRHTFIVYGGYPGKWIAGNIGMLFGTFVASGLYHECAMYAMGRGWDWSVILFFAIQGPILISERLWRRVTGKKVEGPLGKAWVYFVMIVLGQPMVNSWHRRGLGGGMVIPPMLSPVRLILLPIIQHFIHRNP